MTEADEQMTVVEYCEAMRIPVYSIPNEGQRSYGTAMRLKKMGLKPGIPDLCIPLARCGFHSLYIEMKAKGGKITKEQREWIFRLRSEGMCAYVCYGADDAINLIGRYTEGLLDSQ